MHEKPPIIERDNEQALYEERADFVRKNYPIQDSNYDIADLLNSGLDGMDVLEARSKDGEIEGIISYDIGNDNNDVRYVSVGIILVSEEVQGEGVISNLFLKLENIARENECEYIVAIADTEEGEEFFTNKGFSQEIDEINGREHFRLDL